MEYAESMNKNSHQCACTLKAELRERPPQLHLERVQESAHAVNTGAKQGLAQAENIQETLAHLMNETKNLIKTEKANAKQTQKRSSMRQ